MTTADLISHEISRLSDEKQARVLEFARALANRPVGARLQDLQRLAGSFKPEDLNEIEKAIEEDCERVDAKGW